MGEKPSAAASAAATNPTAAAGGRFSLPHALVIIACIVTAAILAPSDMDVPDVLLLIAGASGIGAVVVAVGESGPGGRIGRFVRAYLTSGN